MNIFNYQENAESKAEQQREEKAVPWLKIAFASLTVGIVITLLLTLYALNQQEKADKYLQSFKSRLYHFQAQRFSDTNPTIALRLAEKAREFNLLDETINDTLLDIYDQGKVFYAPPLHHDKKVNLAVFSPDGEKIVTASYDTAKVWDVQGNALATLKHQFFVYSVAFSNDSQKIVTASYDAAKVWNVQRKTLITLKHDDYVYSAAFSNDSQKIVTASYDTAKVWDVQGKTLITLKHDHFINSATFSNDNQKIVTRAKYNNIAKVWDVQGNLLATLKHESEVNSATFSNDNQKIVTASDDNTAKVWDMQGNLFVTLNGHYSHVNLVAFSPDNQKIVTASRDNRAIIWDISQIANKKGNLKVDDLLKSDRLAKLTLVDEILVGVITLEELSTKRLLTQEIVSNLNNIAQFYENKANQSSLPENQRKYLQQAAMLYQKTSPIIDAKGQEIKSQIADKLGYSKLTQLKYQHSLVIGWENMPLIIFVGLLMLVISRQQQTFFQQQQYLRLVIYSIVPVVALVNWLSLYDGFYYVSMQELKDLGNEFWLIIHLTMAVIMAGLCFFQVRKRFQRQVLRASLQIFCRVLFILFSGYLVYLLLDLIPKMTEDDIKVLIISLVTAIALLLSIFLVYYALRPSDWLLKTASMLLAYTMLLVVAIFLVAFSDNALAFYNPIPTNWQFLLLLVAGAILTRVLFFQFKAYQKQQKWLTIGSFAIVYSVILYLSLMGFWNDNIFLASSPVPPYHTQRVILSSEISDALTLLLAFIATGFAIVWAIKAYCKQNYRDTSIYSLSGLFLLSSVAYHFHAYMTMVSFFTLFFGGILLFIHVVSRAFDKWPFNGEW